MVIGDHSGSEHVELDEEFKTPPQLLFGPEPVHNWYYSYEKADYERRRGDWDAVLSTDEQGFSKGLSPADSIEWMTSLQAYAVNGRLDDLSVMFDQIQSDEYVTRQHARD